MTSIHLPTFKLPRLTQKTCPVLVQLIFKKCWQQHYNYYNVKEVRFTRYVLPTVIYIFGPLSPRMNSTLIINKFGWRLCQYFIIIVLWFFNIVQVRSTPKVLDVAGAGNELVLDTAWCDIVSVFTQQRQNICDTIVHDSLVFKLPGFIAVHQEFH